MAIKFSIIIPSYNEGEDIRLSLESAIAQTYLDKEILIVDDSSDKTPDIVKERAGRGVRLVNGPRNGCCEARNLGIKLATGDVVVLLNADVVLPPDFLERIKVHYDKGADYVLVESKVFNDDNFFARFIEMQHRYESKKIGEKAEWTEGFSGKREALLKIGLIPGNFKIRFCRDWLLGQGLKNAGYKKVIDLGIIVTHKAPDNFSEYWRVRVARGRFGSLGQYFLWERSLPYLAAKFFLKDLLSLLKFSLIIPAVIRVAKISSYSSTPARDFFPFFYAHFLQELARAIGEWQGIFKIVTSKK